MTIHQKLLTLKLSLHLISVLRYTCEISLLNVLYLFILSKINDTQLVMSLILTGSIILLLTCIVRFAIDSNRELEYVDYRKSVKHAYSLIIYTIICKLFTISGQIVVNYKSFVTIVTSITLIYMMIKAINVLIIHYFSKSTLSLYRENLDLDSIFKKINNSTFDDNYVSDLLVREEYRKFIVFRNCEIGESRNHRVINADLFLKTRHNEIFLNSHHHSYCRRQLTTCHEKDC